MREPVNRRAFFRALSVSAPSHDLHEVEAAAVGMGRRDFLKLLTASTAVTTAALVAGLDVDRLFWVPEKTIVLPPAGGWTELNPKQFDRAIYEGARYVPANINAMTQAMLQHVVALRERRGEKPATLVEGRGHRIGDTVAMRHKATLKKFKSGSFLEPITVTVNPVVLTEHVVCDMAVTHESAARERREGVPRAIIAAQAAALEHHMHDRGMNVFAELDLLSGGEGCVICDQKSGITLRGVRYYDIFRDQFAIRFDALGGKA